MIEFRDICDCLLQLFDIVEASTFERFAFPMLSCTQKLYDAGVGMQCTAKWPTKQGGLSINFLLCRIFQSSR